MPARLKKIKKALKKHGVDVEAPPSGSHWHATRGAILYPIPAHNGLKTEIGNEYIKALCRAFDLDYDDFAKNL